MEIKKEEGIDQKINTDSAKRKVEKNVSFKLQHTEEEVIKLFLTDRESFFENAHSIDRLHFIDSKASYELFTLITSVNSISIATIKDIVENNNNYDDELKNAILSLIDQVEFTDDKDALKSNLNHNISLLRRRRSVHDLRGILSQHLKLIEETKEELIGISPDKIKNSLYNALLQTEQSEPLQILKSSDLRDGLFEVLEENIAPDRYQNKVRSNFNQLNTLYPEFRSGHLVIIAARPSVGKTTFSLNLLYENSLKRDMRCLFISLEMNSIELLYKLAKIYCSKNFNGSDSENHLMSSIDAVSRDNIFFAKENTASVETIREVALKLLKYDQLDYIVIDYLQLMKSDSFKNRRSYSKHDEVTDISRSLKLLAQELGLPIITLCQLNREVEKRKDKFNRPFLWDLRDSGAIEQDADAVFLLHTIKEDEDNLNSLFDETEDDKLSEGNGVHEKYIPINYQQNEDERHVKLFVEKNRHGGIGEVDLTFNVKEGVFKERIIQWS